MGLDLGVLPKIAMNPESQYPLNIAFWDRQMATILKEFKVNSLLQKALSGMLECISLHGDSLILGWKQQIADYPDVLAEAMVRQDLDFFPIWALQEHLAARDTTFFQHQIRLTSLAFYRG